MCGWLLKRQRKSLSNSDDAIGHVVDDRLQHLARLLDVAMGGSGFGSRGVELALALARLGDVAGHADHAARASIGVAHRDAVLARPAPRAVAPAIAEFDVEARDLALVEGGNHPRVMRPVVGMDDVGEFAHRPVFRQVEHLDQGRGEIDHPGIEIDVVGAGADADRLERERVAQFQIALVERGRGELLARALPARFAARTRAA